MKLFKYDNYKDCMNNIRGLSVIVLSNGSQQIEVCTEKKHENKVLSIKIKDRREDSLSVFSHTWYDKISMDNSEGEGWLKIKNKL